MKITVIDDLLERRKAIESCLHQLFKKPYRYKSLCIEEFFSVITCICFIGRERRNCYD